MAEVVTAGAAIIAAIIVGLFSVIAQRARRENNDAHDRNMLVLEAIDRRTDQMDVKLDLHGEQIAAHHGWHVGRGDDPPT